MSWLYLACLLVSLGCMVLLDRRFRLFLFADPRRGALVLGVGVVFFLLWDLVAIGLGFYGRGQGEALSGVELLPHLPVEELVFITFLCYLTMVLYGLFTRFFVRVPEEER
ncbi:lycopene cyclase domain-containing protein [Georgenia soli]|uniref:Lycopene cyclase domain-containing protein n=1 Tax=Georgenia soli TaxID=638953 RepID=A0A2A9ELI1_9MICO|nr:lycopene cyclase domain-containing protein [Georgenia soli]PFG39122.1 lycopene cyclase domain-containing protein [Georgenia soli]